MIVLKRFWVPLNIPPHPECANWGTKSLITRRNFVFLRVGGDARVEVVDREVSVFRPKVCSHGQHMPQHRRECLGHH
jgi:hypothetical protein